MLLAVALFGACVWWVLAPPIPEGAILIQLTATHGIDVSDLAALPVLAFAAWLVRPRSGVSRGT